MILITELEPDVIANKSGKSETEDEENRRTIYNHLEAAKHHSLAATYHLLAVRYHQEGNYYEAEQSAFIARGHLALAAQVPFEASASLFTW